jgi:hypothetical protein
LPRPVPHAHLAPVAARASGRPGTSHALQQNMGSFSKKKASGPPD